MAENEESKLKVYFRKFKKLWGDKRYKSIFILLLYFLFFIILFAFLNLNKNVIDTNYKKTINFASYDTYDFLANISINGYIYDIQGKRYKNKYDFIYGDQQFNLSFEDILKSDIDSNIINLFRYTPDLINNMLENSILVSEKKIIADNTIVKEYSLDIEKYLQILDYSLLSYNLNDKIVITVNELDKQITKVELNLSNFYKNLEENYQEYKITINYSNLNN
ncbi:MAG: hypothetical protein HFI86_07345 [Bacilli bacterium]|nr:hypothetical protein [Bacilli bacterium]